MMTPLIENILFGCFQPWVPESFQELVRDAELTYKQHNGQRISLLSWVKLPPAFDRISLTYGSLIEQEIVLLHLEILHKMEELEHEQDKLFVLTQHFDELWELLEEISKLAKDPPFDTGDKQIAETALYVLNMLELLAVNLAVDLGLRCRMLDPGFTFDPDQLYLTALDRPPPDPSPFFFTAEWYRLRLKNIFRELSADLQLTVDRKRQIVRILEDLGKQCSYDQYPFSSFDVQYLVNHAENALFLVMMDASFLKDDAGRLSDPDFCHEWVVGMRQDILFGNSEIDVISCLQKLDRAGLELTTIMEPVSGPFRDLARSAAARWIAEWEDLSLSGRYIPPMVRDDRGKINESGAVDFTTYFNNRFVHRQELEAALNIDRKTLDSYLETGKIRYMSLKQNKWYLREDVDKFFDENTE